jgi:hypothetical protein
MRTGKRSNPAAATVGTLTKPAGAEDHIRAEAAQRHQRLPRSDRDAAEVDNVFEREVAPQFARLDRPEGDTMLIGDSPLHAPGCPDPKEVERRSGQPRPEGRERRQRRRHMPARPTTGDHHAHRVFPPRGRFAGATCRPAYCTGSATKPVASCRQSPSGVYAILPRPGATMLVEVPVMPRGSRKD